MQAAPDGGLKPGTLYVLKDGKLEAIPVRTGITDGAFTEIQAEGLAAGSLVVIGLDVSPGGNRAGLSPPPGMGGPMMRPGGGGRR